MNRIIIIHIIIQDKIINMLKETDPDEAKYFKSFKEETKCIH